MTQSQDSMRWGHGLPKGATIAFDELNMKLFPGETLAAMETIGLPQMRLQRFPFATSMSYMVIGD